MLVIPLKLKVIISDVVCKIHCYWTKKEGLGRPNELKSAQN